ncbi:MAG TPA: glycosyltransferase family 4 protein [archaeon]|nr:glycosyltransferase family 4 protein [archaeon]
MKKIRIFIQYPNFFSDSPYYNYLTKYPPKNIVYLSEEKKRNDIIVEKSKLLIVRAIKDNIRTIIRNLKLPIINAYKTTTKIKYDLIHCAHCLSLEKEKNWIIDLECAWQIGIGNTTEETVNKALTLLEKKNCKKIICWTEKTKQDFEKLTKNKLKDKTVVIYPAVPINNKINRTSNKINLVFVARYFKWKGGEYALNVIDKLTKKYPNVFGIVVTENIKLAKSTINKNDKITYFPLMNRSELFKKVYTNTDIFIYPGLSDSFGFSFLEAMSFGLPIVTVEGHGRREIIKNKKNGFIVGKDKYYLSLPYDQDLEKQIIKKTELLIKNKKLRKEIGKNNYFEVKQGKFSIKTRNTKLAEVYKQSIK